MINGFILFGVSPFFCLVFSAKKNYNKWYHVPGLYAHDADHKGGSV